MTNEQQAVQISAAFPAPPPFYKHFTTENLTRLEELKASNESAIDDIPPDAPIKPTQPFDITSLPPELSYLIPPPTPTGEYRSFNTTHGARSPHSQIFIEGQASIGKPPPYIELPPPVAPSSLPNPQRLRGLLHSILLQFLSLSKTLSIEPADYPPKYLRLKDLFIEAHGVINGYRPHQARETLIEMMEEQVRKGREEIKICGEAREKTKEVLSGLKNVNGEVDGKVDGKVEGNGPTDKSMKRRKRTWDTMRENEDRRVWLAVEKELHQVP